MYTVINFSSIAMYIGQDFQVVSVHNTIDIWP